MSVLKAFLKGSAVAALLAALDVAAFAGAWDSAHLFDSPEKTVERVVVTGNFIKPRLLAEMVRKETKTPYLLLPMPGDTRIFFCPAGKGPALEIREADLPRFMNFLKPKLVIVLGDSRFTPDYYIGLLGSGFEKVVIDSDNWFTNATTLGNLIDFKSLPERYLLTIGKPGSAKWSMDGEESVPKPEPVIQLAAPVSAQAPANAAASAAVSSSASAALPETMILMPAALGTDEPALLVPLAAKSGRSGGK